VARITLTGINVAVGDGIASSSTTMGAIGGYAIVVATVLADRGITLTSSYLSAMIGDIAASHLCSAPGADAPRIEQHILPGQQPGQTHAQACLLDHVAELQQRVAELSDELVRVKLSDRALAQADEAWRAGHRRAQ
jgi:uncharacterized small protein (DUF1192 family)